jgi:integrase
VLTEDYNGIWLAIPNEASKSKKGRTIQLNEEQAETIRMIQTLWLESGATNDHIKYYSRKFKDARDVLCIDKHKSFHSLRHYFGKTQVTISGNIYQVSGLMGHSSVKVTEDNYVKGFDRKSTLRDFPSLREYLIDANNSQKVGGNTPNGIPQVHKHLE